MAEERLIAMEEKVAHLERTVEELHQVIWGLNRDLAQLRKEWRDVRSHATAIDPNRKPEDDVPPHW
ncbi:MAG: SlyX family protein [Phycisphaerae bacterium]|nr:SlyX family protein [Phycisphaerae bacterium]